MVGMIANRKRNNSIPKEKASTERFFPEAPLLKKHFLISQVKQKSGLPQSVDTSTEPGCMLGHCDFEIGMTPLHFALTFSQDADVLEIVKLLTCYSDSPMPSTSTASSSSPQTGGELYNNAAQSLKIRTARGYLPLHTAASSCSASSVDLIDYLLLKYPEAVLKRTYARQSAFSLVSCGACSSSEMKVRMKKLLKERMREVTSCSYGECSIKEGLSRCSKCKTRNYCCVRHQQQDWKSHKTECEALLQCI